LGILTLSLPTSNTKGAKQVLTLRHDSPNRNVLYNAPTRFKTNKVVKRDKKKLAFLAFGSGP